jgi:hypothetical protein
MKKKTIILRVFSLSCLLAGMLVFSALKARANDNFLPDDNKDKLNKKAATSLLLRDARKTTLSLDAGFRYSGTLNSEFKLTPTNYVNFKSVMTYKRGNVTYVLPYTVQIQQPSNMQFHKLQIVLPLK